MVNQHNQGIMIRLHLFLGISGKDAVLGPQKLSSELFASLEFLGQFLRSLDCIFPRIPRKKVESWPNIHHNLYGKEQQHLIYVLLYHQFVIRYDIFAEVNGNLA